MRFLLRRLRGIIGVGLTWAVAWGLAGLGIGAASRLLPWLPWGSFFAVFDAPLPALAVPGFVAGTLYALLLAALPPKRFDDLRVPLVAGWGAVGGLALTLFPLLASGLAVGPWLVLLGPFVLLSAGSAAGSLWLAQRAQGHPELPTGRSSSLL